MTGKRKLPHSSKTPGPFRWNWMLGLVLVGSVFLLGNRLLNPIRGQGVTGLPVSIQARITADYSPWPDQPRYPRMQLNILKDFLADLQLDDANIASRLAVILEVLDDPIPEIDPTQETIPPTSDPGSTATPRPVAPTALVTGTPAASPTIPLVGTPTPTRTNSPPPPPTPTRTAIPPTPTRTNSPPPLPTPTRTAIPPTVPPPTPPGDVAEAIQEIEAAIAELEGLIAEFPDSADKLEDAIAKLNTALAELHKSPPDIEAAIGNIEGARGDIQAAVDDGSIPPTSGNSLDNTLKHVIKIFK